MSAHTAQQQQSECTWAQLALLLVCFVVALSAAAAFSLSFSVVRRGLFNLRRGR
jgi:hypothetical protein